MNPAPSKPLSAFQNPRPRAVDVERAVVQWILRGELSAGQKLTEQEVAECLGVSRGPVREALRALAEAGLLQIEPNRGTLVRKVHLNQVHQIHDVYSAVEELASRGAARSLSGTQVEELKALVESMEPQRKRKISTGISLSNSTFTSAWWRAAATKDF